LKTRRKMKQRIRRTRTRIVIGEENRRRMVTYDKVGVAPRDRYASI